MGVIRLVFGSSVLVFSARQHMAKPYLGSRGILSEKTTDSPRDVFMQSYVRCGNTNEGTSFSAGVLVSNSFIWSRFGLTSQFGFNTQNKNAQHSTTQKTQHTTNMIITQRETSTMGPHRGAKSILIIKRSRVTEVDREDEASLASFQVQGDKTHKSSRVKRHVSFETYLTSRWSNGSAKRDQPLIPYARR